MSARRAGLLLLAACALAAPPRARAQDSAAAALPAPAAAPWADRLFGVQVGYQRTRFTGAAGDATLTAREGALAGIFYQRRLARWLALRPELLLALKGGRIASVDETTGETVPVDLELAYFELPLLFRVHWPRGLGKVRPVAFAGPAVSFRFGCQLGVELEGQPFQASCEEADLLDVRRVDASFVAGAGLEVRWFSTALGLEARYTAGQVALLPGGAVKNRGWALAAVLAF